VNFVSSSGAVGSDITSLNLTMPSAVQSGDTLIAVVALSAGVTNMVSAPTGWKTLQGYPLTETFALIKSVWVFQKTADANTTSGNLFSFSSTNARGVLLAYRGVRSVREAHRVSATNVRSLTAPSLETVKGALVLSIVSLSPINHERSVFSLQPLSARFDSGATRDLTLYAADRSQTQTGPSGELRFEARDESGATYPEPYTAVTLALEP
jgi:hypothetical protein